MPPKIRTRTPPDTIRRRALIMVAICVPVLGAFFAVPRMMGSDDPGAGAPAAAAVPTPAAPADVGDDDADLAEAEPALDPTKPHAGGDLEVALSLRSASVPSGRPVRARVTIENLSLETVHVPAPGEPQTTLRIVVVDEQGETVRDIVETAEDAMPRRTHRIASGEELSWDVDVVAAGEAPLPPGTYRLVAVYDASPAWKRTGLPMWTAPGGARRAEQIELVVTAP